MDGANFEIEKEGETLAARRRAVGEGEGNKPEVSIHNSST